MTNLNRQITGNGGYDLTITGDYYNTLDIEGFSHMLKDPSYCYKFYWLEAIVHKLDEGVSETTFNDVIDEMIAYAWYSVREFHIHLSGMQADGEVRDGLERAILKLSEISNLSANASKVEIKNAIKEHESELKTYKSQLYRKGNSKEEFINILSKNMQPVYDSARRQGYELWMR